ncbi:MAG: pilin [Pseudomonadota bacterium]
MKNKGFSLIELMVVVAILGILSSYVLPELSGRIVSKQVGEGIGLSTAYQETIVDYYKTNGRFPPDNSALGIPPPDKIIGNYTTKLAIENGAIHITFGNHVHKALASKVLSLRPLTVPSSPKSPISWTCGYREAPNGMQPNGENKTNTIRHMTPLHCL